MTDTPRRALQFLDAGSLQIDVPFNDNLLEDDATINLSVVSAVTTAQPGAPSNGHVYILPAGKTGAQWDGFAAGNVAIFYSGTWTAYSSYAGMTARAADTGELYTCTAANTWVTLSTLLGSKGTDIASATTTNLEAATGWFVHITGTTTITAFGTSKAGKVRYLRFAGALTLTHHATSLILPTGANILTAANDVAVVLSEGSGNWRCIGYTRADGTALKLLDSAMEYKGAWDASTNTPTLVNGVGNSGDTYKTSVAGTRDLGGGSVTYKVGDTLIYNAGTAAWDRIPSGQPITSSEIIDALAYTPERTYPVVTAMGSVSGGVVVDLSLGKYYTMTLSSNITITFSNPPASGYATDIVLIITQHASSAKTVAITGAKYPNGIAYAATTSASAEDHVAVRVRDNGSTISAYPVENMA